MTHAGGSDTRRAEGASQLLSTARWRLVEPLLDAALDRITSERALFLEAACRHDPALRDEVLALLADCEAGERAGVVPDLPATSVYASLLADDAPPLPRILGGRYRIVQEISRGGMGAVHLAEDERHGRPVAVKVLLPDVLRVVGGERFAQEVATVARLWHPHILPLHDSGWVSADGSRTISDADHDDASMFLYFVSPYVAGGSLRDLLARETRLPAHEAVRLATQVATALDYAHREGVVHLDVKPENVLLHDGQAVIADFGISRRTPSRSRDADGAMAPAVGTAAYMSPEQARGEIDLDARSDVYSLGCVLYEMLAGTPPFAPTSVAEALACGRATAPPDPAPLHASAPRPLAAIVLRAMAADRAMRFPSAGALAQALGAWAPVAARGATARDDRRTAPSHCPR